jgi:hypothetical protein
LNLLIKMPENLRNDLKDAQYNRGMNKRPMLVIKWNRSIY